MLPPVGGVGITRQPFLAGVAPEAEAELRSLGVRRRFPAGAAVFLEGDVAHDALLLLDGTVKIAVTAFDGREVILDVLGEGALVGELSAIDGHARSATAYALTPVEVLAVPCGSFIELMHRRPALMYELLVSVANRPGAVHDMLVPLKTHGVSMSRFESRPARSGQWEYYFYIDLAGHPDDARVATALGELRGTCAFFKVLGSYPVDTH